MARLNMRIFVLTLLVAVLFATASAKAPTKTSHSDPTGTCTKKFPTHSLAPTPKPGTNKCKSFTDTFKSKKSIVLQENYNGKPSPNGPNWIDLSGTNGKGTVIGPDGLELLLSPPKKGQKYAYATTLTSAYKMQYGTVVAEMKTNETPGFVNAFIMMSQAGDEIDWEFVGKEPTSGQSNFYFQGYKFYGVNSGKHTIKGAANATFHQYGFHWSPTVIQWSINGVVIRTAKKADSWNPCDKKYHFPYQAGNIQLGVWDGSTSPVWSNGPINWKAIKSPLKAYIKSVTVTCDPTWNILV